MDFQEKIKGYPENGGQEFIPNNEEELLQAAENIYKNNKPVFKKGCAKLFVIGIAIFIGISFLASVLEPYAPLDEDGNKTSFNYASAICIGFLTAVISLRVLIHKMRHCTQKITADIIGANRKQTCNGNMYKTVYEYYFDGQIYRTESRVSTSGSPKTNRKITLRINPDNPQEIIDKRFLFFCVGILIMGLFILSVTIVPILIAVFKA